MFFEPTPIAGVWVLSPDPRSDERGYFARVYCKREFREHGIECDIVQANSACSYMAGTVRGLHYQPAPHPDPKLIRCVRGAIFDVIIDMRPESQTYLDYFSIELTGENGLMLYVPPLCAHGYMTLVDQVEVSYLAGEYYVQGSELGIRFDDPEVGIAWPRSATVVSERDRNWPLLNGDEQ